jgi:hypothetical protein
MKNFITILSIAVLAFSVNLNAQIEKFGKIKTETLELTQDKEFPDATALILFDVGDVKIEYVADGFQISQKRHVRIKIFSKAGYKYADVVLPQYLKSYEKFKNVSANVFNLDERGKVIREKLDSKMIFDEDIDNKINRKRFTLPSVKEGTVIEYEYEIVSDRSFRIIDWDFQHEIPVKYSEYNLSYPEYFNYLSKYQGNFSFLKKDMIVQNIPIQYKESVRVMKGKRVENENILLRNGEHSADYRRTIYEYD